MYRKRHIFFEALAPLQPQERVPRIRLLVLGIGKVSTNLSRFQREQSWPKSPAEFEPVQIARSGIDIIAGDDALAACDPSVELIAVTGKAAGCT